MFCTTQRSGGASSYHIIICYQESIGIWSQLLGFFLFFLSRVLIIANCLNPGSGLWDGLLWDGTGVGSRHDNCCLSVIPICFLTIMSEWLLYSQGKINCSHHRPVGILGRACLGRHWEEGISRANYLSSTLDCVPSRDRSVMKWKFSFKLAHHKKRFHQQHLAPPFLPVITMSLNQIPAPMGIDTQPQELSQLTTGLVRFMDQPAFTSDSKGPAYVLYAFFPYRASLCMSVLSPFSSNRHTSDAAQGSLTKRGWQVKKTLVSQQRRCLQAT